MEQSVARPIADPGVASSIQARSHTFVKIDHKFLRYFSSLALIQGALVSIPKRKYVHSFNIKNKYLKGAVYTSDQGPELQCLLKVKEDLS